MPPRSWLVDSASRLRGTDHFLPWRSFVDAGLRILAAAINGLKLASVGDGRLRILLHNSLPDAVDWVVPHLMSDRVTGPYRLGVGDIPAQYPAQAFRLTKALVANDVLPANARHVLRQLLDRLKATRPALAQAPAFQKLYRLAAG